MLVRFGRAIADVPRDGIAERCAGARPDPGPPRRIRLFAEFWGGVRYAGRSIRRRPTLAAAVIITLALGLGSNTAVFSVAHATLLQPLPYRDADRVV